jgi:hypothetical protein
MQFMVNHKYEIEKYRVYGEKNPVSDNLEVHRCFQVNEYVVPLE